MSQDVQSQPLSGDPDGGDDAPDLMKLPLDQWHRDRGGRMVPFAGYEMPVQYEGIMAEHLWTRESAGLFDVSHMGQLIFSGEGLDAALEALMPVDMATAKPGNPVYSLLMAENGGILDDLMLTRRDDGSVYMVVNGACKWDDIGHFREQMPDAIEINYLEDQALLGPGP